ncbi:MAG TPA: CBS domain-containing protein [Cyclobacteriaceae bacterium]|nr:CBS domain-containing protein [Cyclobacteriaceae bacterium]HOO09434.1 CBS domain-containing protein [Cyclobacteriaceae bacterium]
MINIIGQAFFQGYLSAKQLKMKKNEPVGHIMTKNVLSVDINANLKEVKDMINRQKIRHVPVVKEKQLVGIISKTDINRLSFSGLFEDQNDADEAIFEMLTLGQVMTHKPKVVKATDPIKSVAEIFASSEFHALPVVSEHDPGKLEGIVTTTDVIRYMLGQY